jgi:hypothetical protein
MRSTMKWKVAGLGLAVALAPSAAAPPVRAALKWTARQADDETVKLRRLFAHLGAPVTATAPLSSQPTVSSGAPHVSRGPLIPSYPHAASSMSGVVNADALRAVFEEGVRQSQPEARSLLSLAIGAPGAEGDVVVGPRSWLDVLGTPVFIAQGVADQQPTSLPTFRAAPLSQPPLARLAAEPTPAPEPSPLVLMSTGLLAIMGLRAFRAAS